MHQIVLSESAAAEISQLNKLDQLEIVSEFSRLRKETVIEGHEGVGKISKGNRTIYRSRFNDYRIYFEKQDDQVIVHHVLHRNTLRDFFVRSNLDMQNDDEFEETAKFWKFIEQRRLKIMSPSKTN
jgi:mRNA-degrading endonuclease RelE of RelBE toxin-antitoxin system